MRRSLLLTGLLVVAANVAGAEPRHVVKPGETLWGISGQHSGHPQAWPRIQQRNNIPEPRLLQPGKVLSFDAQALLAGRGQGTRHGAQGVRSGAAAASRSGRPIEGPVQVLAATGDVQWRLSAAGKTQPAQAGMALPFGAVVRTGPDSFVTLQLPDGSRSTLPSHAEVRVTRVPNEQGRSAMLLELNAGSVETRVPPHPDAGTYGEAFRVRTRMATVGVRGTRFRVGLDDADNTSVGVLESHVLVRAAGLPDTLLGPGEGVVVREAAGTAPPPALTQATQATQALLPAPALDDPGQVQEQPAVVIAWHDVPGAASYRIQLARDADFLDVFTEQRVPAQASPGRASFDNVPAGSWFARATALTPQGLEGLPAFDGFMRLRLALSGTASAIAGSNGVEFHWSALPGASYELQVADDAQFEHMRLNAPALQAETVRVQTLPPGQYWWRVRATSRSQGQQSETISAGRPLLIEGAR